MTKKKKIYQVALGDGVEVRDGRLVIEDERSVRSLRARLSNLLRSRERSTDLCPCRTYTRTLAAKRGHECTKDGPIVKRAPKGQTLESIRQQESA
jgi:hypothetical protein